MSNIYSFSVPFSKQLELIRVARGYTQAQLASEAGFDPAVISRYERGMLPNPQNINKIEAVLDIRFDDPNIQAAFLVLAGRNGND